MNFGNRLSRAKAQADSNAARFDVPYYVVNTTAGLYVEHERPADSTLIVYVAYPSDAFGRAVNLLQRWLDVQPGGVLADETRDLLRRLT